METCAANNLLLVEQLSENKLRLLRKLLKCAIQQPLTFPSLSISLNLGIIAYIMGLSHSSIPQHFPSRRPIQ